MRSCLLTNLKLAGLGSYWGRAISNAAANNHLDTLLADKLIRGYPIVDFIHDVYGVTKEHLAQQAPSQGYYLPQNFFKQYIGGKYSKLDQDAEICAHKLLLDIFEDTGRQLKDRVRAPSDMTSNACKLVNMQDRAVEENITKLHPDFLNNPEQKQKWKAGGHGGELVKDLEEKKMAFELKIHLNKLPDVSGSANGALSSY